MKDLNISLSPRLFGLLLAFVGILLLSPDAALTRLFDGHVWTLVFWRALGTVVVLGSLSIFILRANVISYFKDLPWSGWLAVAMFSYGSVLWLGAVTYAGGATVLALLAFAPLVAALGGRLILGEAITMVTVICSLIALVGVGLTVWDGILSSDISLFGLLLAIALPINHALIFVLLRKLERTTTWPILSLGSALLLPIAFFFAPTIMLTTSAQMWSVVPMVGVVATLSFAFMALATRYIPASDIMLVNLLEPIVGVVFLWWIVQELPTQNQWIGGTIVVLAVTIFSLWQISAERNKTR